MDNNHELTQWIVTYGPEGMPGLIQGLMKTGDSKELKSLAQVQINDVFALDLRNNTITTNAGIVWNLIGPGTQSVLIGHVEPFEYIHVHEDEPDDDDGEEGFDEEN